MELKSHEKQENYQRRLLSLPMSSGSFFNFVSAEDDQLCVNSITSTSRTWTLWTHHCRIPEGQGQTTDIQDHRRQISTLLEFLKQSHFVKSSLRGPRPWFADTWCLLTLGNWGLNLKIFWFKLSIVLFPFLIQNEIRRYKQLKIIVQKMHYVAEKINNDYNSQGHSYKWIFVFW